MISTWGSGQGYQGNELPLFSSLVRALANELGKDIEASLVG